MGNEIKNLWLNSGGKKVCVASLKFRGTVRKSGSKSNIIATVYYYWVF